MIPKKPKLKDRWTCMKCGAAFNAYGPTVHGLEPRKCCPRCKSVRLMAGEQGRLQEHY